MIPSNFVGQARGLIWSVTKIFLPAFSGLDALNEKEKSRNLYFGASRFMLGVIVPLIVGIVLLGPSFLEHWMGQEYARKGLYVLYIIATVQIFSLMNPFSKRYLTAIDKHEILARIGVMAASLNLLLSISLVQYIGIEGVAIGTLVPTAVFEPYLLYKSCQELGSTVMAYFRSVLLPLAMPVICFVLFLKIVISTVPVQSLFDILWMAIASMLLYVPLFFVFSMKPNERHSVICSFRNFMRKVN